MGKRNAWPTCSCCPNIVQIKACPTMTDPLHQHVAGCTGGSTSGQTSSNTPVPNSWASWLPASCHNNMPQIHLAQVCSCHLDPPPPLPPPLCSLLSLFPLPCKQSPALVHEPPSRVEVRLEICLRYSCIAGSHRQTMPFQSNKCRSLTRLTCLRACNLKPGLLDHACV